MTKILEEIQQFVKDKVRENFGKERVNLSLSTILITLAELSVNKSWNIEHYEKSVWIGFTDKNINDPDYGRNYKANIEFKLFDDDDKEDELDFYDQDHETQLAIAQLLGYE